jgi:serine/threonine protein kinase
MMANRSNPDGEANEADPGAVWQPPSLAELAAALPQFEFIELIGAGGMGAVYKARQIALDRVVAIKVMPPYADDGSGAKFVERFINEARVMAKLTHVCIVGVYDFGQMSDGHLYLAMEFIDGSDVQQLIDRKGRLKPEEALAITAHVCDALQYAHSRGVTHRDVKPANVLISREGYIKVVDFGLAKAAHLATIDHPEVTMGTPAFMAPEVLHSEEHVDGRSDIYSVGAMLYNMLTGKLPEGTFWPASQIAMSDPRFDRIIQHAMEADPKRRYQQAQEIRKDLDDIAATPMVAKGQKGLSVVSNVQVRQTGIVKKKIPAAKIAPLKKTSPGAPAGRSAYTSPKKIAPKEASSSGMIGIIAILLAVGGAVIWYFTSQPDESSTLAPQRSPVVIAPAPVRPVQAQGPDARPRPLPHPQIQKDVSRPIESASGAPKEVPADGSWMNILPQVKIPRDAKKFSDDASASWQIASGILKLATEPVGVVAVIPPVELPDCYEITMLTRIPGTGASCGFLLPVGERHVNLRVEINARGHPFGLEMIEGEMLANSPAVAASVITPDVEQMLSIRVGSQEGNVTIDARIDGRTAFTWSGRETSLKLAPKWDHATPRHIAFVSDGAAAMWSDVKLRRILPGDILAGTTTPSEIVTFAGRRYQFIPAKLNWTNAKSRAESLGGHLATVTSTNEDDFIRTTFARCIPANNSAFWIGLSRDDASSGWRWVTGEPLAFSGWGKGEPNAESGGGVPPYHVGYSRRSSGGDIKWADTAKDHQDAPGFIRGFVVEWDSAAATAAESNNVEARLAAVAAQFTVLHDEKIVRPHKESIVELNSRYAAALDHAMKADAAANSSDQLKWESEKSRVENGGPMPEVDGERTPDGIKKLRAAYRPQFAKLDAIRIAKLKAFYDRYDRVLAEMQAEFARAGKPADTAAIKTRREEIATQRAAALPPAASN